MKILSLFDGISCARVALDRAGISVEEYYASEIDKHAIYITTKNWPQTVQLGDVRNTTLPMVIDLLIGGSPCQDLSIAKKDRKGLRGDRSGLFFEYVRTLNEVKPRYFILENVASMPKADKEEITRTLGVEPVMINAALVSAQSRKRLFWIGKRNEVGVYTQAYIPQPEDRGIMLRDILEKDVPLDKYGVEMKKSKTVRTSGRGSGIDDKHNWDTIRIGQIGEGQSGRVYSTEGKSINLQANGGGRGANTGLYMIQTPRGKNKGGVVAKDGKTPTLTSSSFEHNNKLVEDGNVRKLTPVECERLQSLPDNYTQGASDTQRYKMLGNAFNVEVIAHILKHIEL